jgi:hypothetical protein
VEALPQHPFDGVDVAELATEQEIRLPELSGMLQNLVLEQLARTGESTAPALVRLADRSPTNDTFGPCCGSVRDRATARRILPRNKRASGSGLETRAETASHRERDPDPQTPAARAGFRPGQLSPAQHQRAGGGLVQNDKLAVNYVALWVIANIQYLLRNDPEALGIHLSETI